jgi:hypothetical protein
MDTAIGILIFIIGAFSGVLGLLYFICKDDDRPIADQLRAIQALPDNIESRTRSGM